MSKLIVDALLFLTVFFFALLAWGVFSTGNSQRPELIHPAKGGVWVIRNGTPWGDFNRPITVIDARDGWVRFSWGKGQVSGQDVVTLEKWHLYYQPAVDVEGLQWQ